MCIGLTLNDSFLIYHIHFISYSKLYDRQYIVNNCIINSCLMITYAAISENGCYCHKWSTLYRRGVIKIWHRTPADPQMYIHIQGAINDFLHTIVSFEHIGSECLGITRQAKGRYYLSILLILWSCQPPLLTFKIVSIHSNKVKAHLRPPGMGCSYIFIQIFKYVEYSLKRFSD